MTIPNTPLVYTTVTRDFYIDGVGGGPGSYNDGGGGYGTGSFHLAPGTPGDGWGGFCGWPRRNEKGSGYWSDIHGGGRSQPSDVKVRTIHVP